MLPLCKRPINPHPIGVLDGLPFKPDDLVVVLAHPEVAVCLAEQLSPTNSRLGVTTRRERDDDRRVPIQDFSTDHAKLEGREDVFEQLLLVASRLGCVLQAPVSFADRLIRQLPSALRELLPARAILLLDLLLA